MAVVHLKSPAITNLTATPRVVNNANVSGGVLKSAMGVVNNSASDSVGSTYRFCRVPSNARVSAVIYAAEASGATGQVDIGLYQTAENGGAVVDADFFASALDPGGGAIAPTNVTHESGQYSLDESDEPLWSALGLTSDPGIDYDVAATVTEIMADANSAQKVEVLYVV